MFFHITELERRNIHFDVLYKPGEIAFDVELRQVADLHSTGSAELLKNTLGEIRIRGHVRTELEADCDRCLEPARLSLDQPFDLFYRPAGSIDTHQEMQIGDGEIDIAFYDGDGVALEEAVREFVLLALPMQHYCRPECKGICPACGANRNEGACGCAARPADDRWAALREL
jgi:uncharacterized protein